MAVSDTLHDTSEKNVAMLVVMPDTHSSSRFSSKQCNYYQVVFGSRKVAEKTLTLRTWRRPLHSKNFFELLEANDPEILDAVFANEDDTQETSTNVSSSTSNHHVYEPDIDPVEELRFQWACFLETLITTKRYVGMKWLASSNERYHLLYLAFMTEAGIALMGKEHDDVMSLARKFKELHLQFSADPATTLPRTLVSILDIKEVRKTNPGFLIPLPSLVVRRGQTELIDSDWAQEETFLVQYLMEIGLEYHVRKMIYETEMAVKRGYKQPISPMSFDQLSRVLQSIGDDNPQLATIAFAAELLLALGPRNDFNIHANTKRMLKDTITEAEVIDNQIDSVKKSRLAFSTALQDLGERGRTIQQWIISCPLQEHRYKALRMLPVTSELSGIHRVAWDGLVLSPEGKEELRIATLSDQDHAGDPAK